MPWINVCELEIDLILITCILTYAWACLYMGYSLAFHFLLGYYENQVINLLDLVILATEFHFRLLFCFYFFFIYF